MSAPDARIRVMFALQLPQLVASVTAPRPGAQCARATHGFEKKKDLARTFSEDWEAVLNLAGDLAGVPVDDALEVVWEDNEPRSESELMDALTKPRSLGVPLATIWAEMGYSPEMSDDPLNQARRKLLASTSAMLGTLTAEDVGGTFRSIAPGLEAARATGRTSAVTAIPGLRKDVADGDEAQRKALDWQEAKAAELRAELAGLPDAPGLSRQRPRAPIVWTSSSRRDRFAMSIEEARISSVLDNRVRDLALSPVASTLRAVERYQDGGHTLLNRVLWQAPESLQRLGDADLGRFRSMLNGLQWLSREFGSPGITVWRGIPTSRGLAVNRLTPGDQLPRLKGFISTSVEESIARSFLGDGPKGVLYRLSVPAGTPGAWLPAFGPEKWRWQAEFLLPPNCSIVVSGVDLSGRVPIVQGEVTF